MPRGGEIWNLISKLFWTSRRDEVTVVIAQRGSATGLREIRLSEVVRLGRGYMELEDGSIIPLHRVVEIRVGENRLYIRGGASRNGGVSGDRTGDRIG